MTDEPQNRISGNDGVDPENESDSSEEQAMGFTFMPSGDDAVFKTPFGIIKISIGTNEDLSELNDQLAGIFSNGINPSSLEELQQFVLSLEPVKEILKQTPQLKDLLEQSLSAMHQGQLKKPSQKKPNKKNDIVDIPKDLKTQGMSFERFYDTDNLN